LKGSVVKVFKKMVAVLAFVLLFGASAWGSFSLVDNISKAVDKSRGDQISTTQSFVAIPSYNQLTASYSGPYPAPGVTQSLNFILKKAQDMGFKTVLHEGWETVTNTQAPLYGYVEYGPKDAKEMVMSIGHLDTVPPGDEADWTLAKPYDGKIVAVDGVDYFIGRGIYDNKGASLASLYALKAIKDSGVELNRRIRLLFGTTEDFGGWICTREYGNKARDGIEEWPVLGIAPDAGKFSPVYIEKASVSVTGNIAINPASVDAITLKYLYGGTASNSVSDSCTATLTGATAPLTVVKAALETAINGKNWGQDVELVYTNGTPDELKINVKGRIAHSGLAWMGIGANNRMMYLLSKSGTTEKWQVIADKLARLLPPDENADNMGVALGINEGSAQTLDNVSVNMGWARYNSLTTDIADKLYIQVNIRYADVGANEAFPIPNRQTGIEIRNKVRDKFAGEGFTVTDLSPVNWNTHEISMSGGSKPYTMPLDSEVILKLNQAYTEVTGLKAPTPSIMYGTTFASAWYTRDVTNNPVDGQFGIRMVAWGIDGGNKTWGDFHEANESMSVEAVINGTKVVAYALASLAGYTEPKNCIDFGCNVAGFGALILLVGCAALFRYRNR
jgi:succinyl-diaminopimelate desuccinylase